MNWFNKLSEQTWWEQQILVFIRNNAVSAKILYIVQFCWKVLSDYIYLSGDSNHGLCYSTKVANCTSLSTGNSGLCSFRTIAMHGFVSKRISSFPDCQGPKGTKSPLIALISLIWGPCSATFFPQWAGTPGFHLSSGSGHQDLSVLCLGWACLGCSLLGWASDLHYGCRSTYRSLVLSLVLPDETSWMDPGLDLTSHLVWWSLGVWWSLLSPL